MRALRDRLNEWLRDGRMGDGYGHPGQIAPSMMSLFSSTVTPTANRAYFARFVPARDYKADLLIFNVAGVAGGDDPVDLGIYEPLDTNRLRRLYSTGAQTGYMLSTLQKRVSIPRFHFKAGKVYYLALSYGTLTGTPTLSATNVSGSSNMFVVPGAVQNIPEIDQTFANTSHPLPDVVTSGGPIAQVPILAISET